VGAGKAIFSPAIARRLLEFFAQLRVVTLPQVLPELSEREREILAPAGPRRQERRDCQSAGPQSTYGAQLCLQHHQQVAGG